MCVYIYIYIYSASHNQPSARDSCYHNVRLYCNKYFAIFEKAHKKHFTMLFFEALERTPDDSPFRSKHVALQK